MSSTEESKARHARKAYIAIAPCGCVHGIDTENGTDTMRQLAEWTKRGSQVDRVPLATAKKRMVMDCPHKPKWGRT